MDPEKASTSSSGSYSLVTKIEIQNLCLGIHTSTFNCKPRCSEDILKHSGFSRLPEKTRFYFSKPTSLQFGFI